MGANRAKKHATSALAIVGAFIATQASPQATGSPLAVITLSQTLEFSDNPEFDANPDGSTLSSRTSLGFTFSSETSIQSLTFEAGADALYELASSGDDPFDDGIDSPYARLNYTRSGANAEFSVDAGYSKSDVGDLRTVTDPFGIDLIVDDGNVERTSFDVALTTGIDAPFGTEVTLSYAKRSYSEVTDPALVGDETFSGDVRLNFALDRATTLSTFARASRNSEADGGYERDSRALGIGVAREIDAATSVSLDVSADEIETTDGATTTEDGISIAAGFNRALPDGALSISASSSIENVGTRNTLRFDRDFGLPAGALGLFGGLTKVDGGDLNLLFGLDYARELADGTISANLSQEVSQDTTSDDELRRRRLAVSYEQQINTVSSWSASVGVNESDNLTSGEETRRSDLSASYSRDLTREWSIVSGYRYAESTTTTGEDRSSNTLFFTVSRDFQFRP